MGDSSLVCTVCGEPNDLPVHHAGVQPSENMTAFNDTRSGVLLQRAQSTPDQMKQQRGISEGTRATTVNSGVNSNFTIPFLDRNEQLWKRLQEALVDNGIPMSDFLRLDVLTKSHIISSMGFDMSDSSKVLEIAVAENPRNLINTPPQTMQQGIETMIRRSPRSGCVSSNSNKGVSAELTNHEMGPGQVVEAPGDKAHNKDSLLGLTVSESGALVAHCSVHPHLPAEFWCTLCGALVSGRCHVVGVHKDHPFLSLRRAAEAHVGDLKTWSERCRSQLTAVNSIVANLQHGKKILIETVKHQEEEVNQEFEDIVCGLAKWRDELRFGMRLEVEDQLRNIDRVMENTTDLVEFFTDRQGSCDPLLHSIPPAHQNDKQSEDWSLRVLNLVSQLKATQYEPIPMPRLTVPEVKSFATTASYMNLLKTVSVPAAVPLPDVLDTGYLNFPNSSDVARETFTLQLPVDAGTVGVLIYSGRTLTRTAGITPVHVLVCGSRVFYTGVTAWAVRVDRMGVGPGRVLAGVLMVDSDGEGVVWDGQRIVGPSEGECRLLPERCCLQTGTILRFVLELEAPAYVLNCFYEQEVVARIPLPPAPSGWVPAFSVFGPQDQITVVPTPTTAAELLFSNDAPDMKMNRGDGGSIDDTEVLLVDSHIDHEQYDRFIDSSKSRQDRGSEKSHSNETTARSPSFNPTASLFLPSGEGAAKQTTFTASSDTKTTPRPHRSSLSSLPLQSSESGEWYPRHDARGCRYGPELHGIMGFVESLE